MNRFKLPPSNFTLSLYELYELTDEEFKIVEGG